MWRLSIKHAVHCYLERRKPTGRDVVANDGLGRDGFDATRQSG